MPAAFTDLDETATIGESAYKQIRDDILSGALRPAQRLRLERLKQDYGASVSTLREILSRLAAERLVVAEGQRGFHVAPISASDLKEIAALRLLLECEAVAQSFAAGDIEWEGRVVSAHHKLAHMERRLVAGDTDPPGAWKRYDWEFHQALVSACGSAVLRDAYAAIYDRYLRYLLIAFAFRGEVAANEHDMLLDCALKRDAATARAVLARHINGCVDYALATGAIA
jgi:DNA-binding GntR family transcriptional regulator